MLEVADKNPGDTYAADEWNEVPGLEMRNLVQNSGQTFNAADNTQLLKGFGILATRGMDYVDSGTVNNYVLNAINSYAQLKSFATGTMVRFFATNTNTGSSDVTINGEGPFNILDGGGGQIAAGDIVAGQYITLINVGGSFRIYDFNDEDIALSLQLASQTAGSEGARLVGNTNNTVYNYSSKAFGYISESAGTYTIENNYNLASVTKLATGKIAVYFTNVLSSADYECVVTEQGSTFIHYPVVFTKATDNVVIHIVDRNETFLDAPVALNIKLVE